MSTIKVTIMIPTYNQEGSIENAIRSAMAQDYKNLEIIISDDCSNDKTGIIAKKYDNNENIRYYRNEQNLGRVSNYRETLYKRATGDYVVNLDGDDIFVDSRFASQAVREIERDKPLLYIACKQINNCNNEIIHNIDEDYKLVKGVDFVLGITNKKYKFSHLTTLYNREFALNTDFYSSEILSTDMDSLLRLALKGKVALSNKVVGQWNETGSNASRAPKFEDLIKNIQWIENVSYDLGNYLSPFKLYIWRAKTKKLFFAKTLYDELMADKLILNNLLLLFKRGVFYIVVIRALRSNIIKFKTYISKLLYE